MEKNKQIIEDLILMRCLGLLFYNFTQEDTKHLRSVSAEFTHMWSELERLAKKKKWFSIPDKEFYLLFANASYDTQAHIITRARERYEGEARNGVKAGLESIAMFKNLDNIFNITRP